MADIYTVWRKLVPNLELVGLFEDDLTLKDYVNERYNYSGCSIGINGDIIMPGHKMDRQLVVCILTLNGWIDD